MGKVKSFSATGHAAVARQNRIKALLAFGSAVLIAAVLTTAGVVLKALDAPLLGSATILRGWHYDVGANLSDFAPYDDALVFIESPAMARTDAKHHYIRLMREIKPDDRARTLTITTWFNKTIVKLDNETLIDTIDETRVYSANLRQHLSLLPAETPMMLEIIVRTGLLPRIGVFVVPSDEPSSPPVTLFTAALALVFVMGVIIAAACLVTGLVTKAPKGREVLFTVGGSGLLYCLFLFTLGISVFFYPDRLWFPRLAFGFAMLSAVVLFYGMLYAHHIVSSFMSTLLSGGVLAVTITLISDSEIFIHFLLRNFSYYLGLIFIVFLAAVLLNPEKADYDFTLLTATNLAGLSSVLILWPNMRHNNIFPICAAAASLIYCNAVTLWTVSKAGRHVRKSISITSDDRSQIKAYRPTNLGRIEKLLEIFLQNPANLTHVQNVSLYVYQICLQSGMGHEEAEKVAKASFLHDIGKIMVPTRTVSKDSALNTEEYEQMKKHTQFGFEILSSRSDAFLQAAAIIAKQHHERHDGNGYAGLKGSEIHPYAQIVCIADVFEATTAARKYKEAWSFDEGFEYIVGNSGIYFSPGYVEAFKRSRSEMSSIYNHIKQSEAFV